MKRIRKCLCRRGLNQPLLDESDRARLYRNSDIDGQNEWMCIICGFDNKTGNESCVMCGTSHQFSKEYKDQKNLKKKLREQQKKNKNIQIPEEEQLTSISMNLKYFSSNGNNSTIQSLLSAEKRNDINNYKRLNQLSLRQKSARRRKMWQRKWNSFSQQWEWIRVLPKDTIVNATPFGYTPTASYREEIKSTGSSNISYVDDNSEEDSRQSLHSVGGGNNLGNNNQRLSSLIHAATEKISQPSKRKRSVSDDSFADSVLGSMSPGFRTVFRPTNESTQTDENGQNLSVGFCSKNELVWEEIQPSRRITNKKPITLGFTTPTKNPDIEAGELKNVVQDEDADNCVPEVRQPEDLESVTAMTFTQKTVWFLDTVSRIGEEEENQGYVKITVRRSNILEDSLKAFQQIQAEDWRKKFRIRFYGESGVDAGGLEREWFGLLTSHIFDQKNGFFTCSAVGESLGGTYHVNPTSGEKNPHHLVHFSQIGRFLAKALMGQQNIPANLSLPLRKQILGVPITFSDMEFVDEELFRNLKWLRDNTNVSNLCLDFTVTYISSHSNTTVCYDLKPNGLEIPVTDENKLEYLSLRLKHRMLDSIKPQLESLLEGIYETIPPDLLWVFDYQELDLLLCGVPQLDLEDWKKHSEYYGMYKRLGENHTVIKWFWEVVSDMSQDERTRLLQFTTGCARLPAQGFKALQSNDGKYRKFNIQSILKSESLFPRAHTCFNKLDLPMYTSKEELDAHLSVVIHMDVTGFSME